MIAAAAAGLYPDILSAQKALSPPIARTFYPDAERTGVYTALYRKYKALAAFAGEV
jgi:L-ribulokinase